MIRNKADVKDVKDVKDEIFIEPEGIYVERNDIFYTSETVCLCVA